MNDGGGDAITVTVAVPKIAPLVARTLFGNVPVVFPAVKRPEAATMVPGGLTVDQTGVIVTTLPLASLPTAVNCCVAPTRSVGFGVTVIVASGPAVTMTVAVAETPLQVTTTVLVYVPGTVPAVNSPVWVIVPPPAATDHTGVFVERTLPSLSVITAVNCCVPFIGMVVVVGAITTVATVRGPLLSPQDAVNSAAIANAAMLRAIRPR
jgi:hypothetical protein